MESVRNPVQFGNFLEGGLGRFSLFGIFVGCIFCLKQLVKTKNTYVVCKLNWVFIVLANTDRNSLALAATDCD